MLKAKILSIFFLSPTSVFATNYISGTDSNVAQLNTYTITPGTGTFNIDKSSFSQIGTYTVTPGSGVWIVNVTSHSQIGTYTVTPGTGTWPLGTGTNVLIGTVSVSGVPTVAINANTNVSIGTVSLGGIPTINAQFASTQPVNAATLPAFKSRSDTYTTTGNGTTVDVTAAPLSSFAIAVKGTGASATTWDVRLEGSLDNSNFTQILQHTQVTGDGVVLYSGSSMTPSLYIRSRCAGLSLGSATNIVVTILGVQQ